MTTLTYKNVGESDDALMFRMYAEVRAGELGMGEWDAALREPLLRQQYEAQRRGYAEEHPAADHRLIERDGKAIGWVIVERRGDALFGVDIALVAEERSRGTGSAVIRALQEEAAAAHCPMIITVLRTNLRAIALYRRLGFRASGENETHVLMEWRDE